MMAEVVTKMCQAKFKIEFQLFTENAPAINEKYDTKNVKQNFSELVDEWQQNKKKILCRRCWCVVLGAKQAILLEGIRKVSQFSFFILTFVLLGCWVR